MVAYRLVGGIWWPKSGLKFSIKCQTRVENHQNLLYRGLISRRVHFWHFEHDLSTLSHLNGHILPPEVIMYIFHVH